MLGKGQAIVPAFRVRTDTPRMDEDTSNGWGMPPSEAFQEVCPGGYGIYLGP